MNVVLYVMYVSFTVLFAFYRWTEHKIAKISQFDIEIYSFPLKIYINLGL